MIRELELENFRAFRRQRFKFARLNIFVGPNNSGKSSAISALNLIAQTIEAERAGATLVLRGKYDDLGTYIDIVHGNVPRTPIGVKLVVDEFTFRITFKYRSKRKETEIARYEIRRRGAPIFEYQQKKDSFDLRYGGKKLDYYLKHIPAVRKTPAFKPEFTGLVVQDRNVRALLFRHGGKVGTEAQKRINQLQSAHMQMRRASSRLSMQLEAAESVSPFRDPPQRTFLFSGETPQDVGRTGSNTVDLLVADSFAPDRARRDLVAKVSGWFSATGMAKGVAIRALTPRHYELCVIGRDGQRHNISDVGFGCSQVLPVLVAGINAFSRSNAFPQLRRPTLLIVQEPEIHLHPDAQAELGSFFVNLLKGTTTGQTFIETHSSNLVLRVQTHIAKGDIAPSDVRIFYVHKTNKRAKVTSLTFNEEGVFLPPWPGRFFPQRQLESMRLAQAAMERRHKKATTS